MYHITITDSERPEETFEQNCPAYALIAISDEDMSASNRMCLPSKDELLRLSKELDRNHDLDGLMKLMKLIHVREPLIDMLISLGINSACKYGLLDELINHNCISEYLEDPSVFINIERLPCIVNNDDN